MIATRSLIPLLAIVRFSSRLALGARLPKVVVNAARGEQAAERHFHFIADRDLGRLAVGHLAQKAAATVEVYHDVDGRGIERIGEAVDGIGRDLRGAIGELVRLHLVVGAALDAYALRRELRSAARGASRADEAELPGLRAHHGRTGGALGIGTARR